MGKVGIIGVGQTAFVRGYPGSIRELVFEGFKDAMEDAGISNDDIDATVVCSAPEYPFTWKASARPAAPA